ERSFAIADEKGMNHVAALALLLKSQITKAKSDEQANELLASAERLANDVNDADLIYRCLALKGEWLLEVGNWEKALAELTKANELLSKWRSDWRNAGHDDTWLEDPLRFKTVLMLAQCIVRKEGVTAADKFVDEIGWLPLKEEWVQKAASLQTLEPKQKRSKRS
ncbi:MAG: hypothetical protein ACK40X_11190, partial [Armatimonadota bacterium]